jgi:hypothetical protein
VSIQNWHGFCRHARRRYSTGFGQFLPIGSRLWPGRAQDSRIRTPCNQVSDGRAVYACTEQFARSTEVGVSRSPLLVRLRPCKDEYNFFLETDRGRAICGPRPSLAVLEAFIMGPDSGKSASPAWVPVVCVGGRRSETMRRQLCSGRLLASGARGEGCGGSRGGGGGAIVEENARKKEPT